MGQYNTEVASEELANGIKDEFDVIYSSDGKRLLKSQNKELQNYTVRKGTEIICNDAFDNEDIMGCLPSPDEIGLYEVVLPDSVKAIGDRAFKRTTLKNINLPEGLVQIGQMAFFNTRIDTIKLPATLELIGDFAFGCSYYLKSITIPKSVSTMGLAPFTNCMELKTIHVAPSNRNFTTHKGMLCDKNKTRLIQSPKVKVNESDLPDTLISCDQGAFSTCIQPESIPGKCIGKWRLQRIKEILQTLTSSPIGVTDYLIPEIGQLTCFKFSNSIYCNLTTIAKTAYIVDKRIDVVTLANALGFVNLDITRYTDLSEDIILRKDNIKQLTGRILASDLTHSYTEDFIDKETSETVSIPRNDTILARGSMLDEELLKTLLHKPIFKEPITLSLYKEQAKDVGQFFFRFIVGHPQDIQAEIVISLFQKEIPHLMLLPFLPNKHRLFYALIDACKRQSVYSIMRRQECRLPQYHDDKFQNICPEDTIPWTDLIEEFFDLKLKRVRTANVATPKLWKQLKEFVVSRGIPEYRVDQFISAFSFLFSDLKDLFCQGPY